MAFICRKELLTSDEPGNSIRKKGGVRYSLSFVLYTSIQVLFNLRKGRRYVQSLLTPEYLDAYEKEYRVKLDFGCGGHFITFCLWTRPLLLEA